MRTNEVSKDELSNQELANVSGGITFVYGKFVVQYVPQSADGKDSQ